MPNAPAGPNAAGAAANRARAAIAPFGGHSEAARGYAEPRGESGVRSGAFSGYDHGGQTRSFSSRGSSSFGARRPRRAVAVRATAAGDRGNRSYIHVTGLQILEHGETPHAANKA